MNRQAIASHRARTTHRAKSADQLAIADSDRLIHEPARFIILAYLYVVESADFLFLMRQTGLTWGNLSSHLSKLEAAGYVDIRKEFMGKKPHTMLRLTDEGRAAFREYRQNVKRVLDHLPDQ
ncbi:MAG: transcriptional regulator [Dehalococcoidia bacterium]|nr:MAG: transcriptional regulator [Dehalococcoidia bacterium]